MKRCLDEGFLQAYVDGELPSEQASEAAAHIAACEACALALASVKNEAAFFAASFAPDESVSVPTEILRARINTAVARLEPTPEANHEAARGLGLAGFTATLSRLFAFTPQGAAAFAGLLAILTLATIFFVTQKSQQVSNSKQIARVEDAAKPTPTTPSVVNPIKDIEVLSPVAPQKMQKQRTTFALAGYKRPPETRKGGNGGTATPVLLKEQPLPGEKDYQTAIASLEKTIRMGGDAVLSPSVRVKYERNIAILDSAIGETRRIAAANPKDKDAMGFLMSAYQSKIELLTKVADQAQIAAVGR